MVYAVASETLQRFEVALGRRVHWRASTRPRASRRAAGRIAALSLSPRHGEANAFYSPDAHGILFGYFRASRTHPGRNLPGQTVFTCLSHDIIAHETTHAIVDGIRGYFTEPTNIDVPAFHEAFADLAALFCTFLAQGSPSRHPAEDRRQAVQRPPGRSSRMDPVPTTSRSFRRSSDSDQSARRSWPSNSARPRACVAACAVRSVRRPIPMTSRPRSNRTTAARFSSPRCSMPISRSTPGGPPICFASTAPAAVARTPSICLEPLADRLAEAASAHGGGVLRHLRPRARLLSAGRHHVRRFPARRADRASRPSSA